MSPSLLLVHAHADSGICKRAFNGCKLPLESTLFYEYYAPCHTFLYFSRFFATVHARVSRKPLRPKTLDLVSCYELKRYV